jgi:3-hydroxyisobutyrate dehydrogenase
MNIAIIGLGEVGRCYAKALQAAGHALSLCDARPSAAAMELAASSKRSVHTSIGAWLSQCDWVLSCVTGARAGTAVDQCLEYARAGTTVCDMTTASPDVKRLAAQRCAERSVRYVDVAIMGAISLSLEKTPLLAAEKQGVCEKLYEQLRDIDETPLRTFIDMLVRTHVVHARRRAHEVHDAAAELAKHGLPSLVLPGVERRFGRTIQALERRPPAQVEPNIDEALTWLLRDAAQA